MVKSDEAKQIRAYNRSIFTIQISKLIFLKKENEFKKTENLDGSL